MPRALRRIGLIAAALVAAAALATFALIGTPPGRALLKPLVAAAVADAIDRPVSIGALEGRLPGEIKLRDVRASDDDGAFLILDEVRLSWRPAALLSGSIDIQRLDIIGGRALRRPLPQARATPPRALALPDDLPRLTLAGFSLTNFDIAPNFDGTPGGPLADRDIRIEAAGSAATAGADFNIRLALTSDAGDQANLFLKRTGGEAEIRTLIMSANGALSRIAGIDGELFLEARGDGPLADAKLAIKGAFGDLVEFDASLLAGLEPQRPIAVEGEARFRPGLAEAEALLGPALKLSGEIELDEARGAARLKRLEGAFGSAAGAVDWTNRGGRFADARGGLSVRFAEAWRPDITTAIGRETELNFEMRADKAEFLVDAALRADRGEARIDGARTDLRSVLAGPLRVTLAPDPEAPPGLRAGGDAEAQIDFSRSRLAIEEMRASLRDGGAASGRGVFDVETESFEIAVTASASPTLIAALAPELDLSGRLSFDLAASGNAASYSLRAIAAAPAARLSGRAVGPMRASLILADLPQRPAGQISMRALDGPAAATANLSRESAGTWRADRLAWRGPGFSLTGALAFNPEHGDAAAQLNYQGTDDAMPIPGITLVGDFVLDGEWRRTDGRARLVAQAQRLEAAGLSVEGLKAAADGPLANLPATISATRLVAAGAPPIEALSAALDIALASEAQARLTRLEGRFDGSPFRLTQAARLGFGDALSIADLRLAIGEGGALGFDATLAADRWRANLDARRAPMAAASAVIDANIVLDTSAATPASGRLAVTSLLSGADGERIGVRLNWNGRELAIEDDGADPAFDLALATPVRLLRAPKLDVESTGRLSGKARYAGRLETFAGFLPPALPALEGDVELDAQISGSVSEPQLAGRLRVGRAALTELSTGLSVVNIEGSADATASPLGSEIAFSAAGSGPGQKEKSVAVDGRISLGAEPRVETRLTLDGARFSAGPVAGAAASGAIDIAGPFNALRASGEIRVSELDARIVAPEPASFTPVTVIAVDDTGASPQSASAAPPAPPIALDIAIRAADRIFIRGRGVESEWRADMRIAGEAAAPLALGEVTLRSGFIDFAGRRFDLTRGVVAFDRLQPNDPALSIRAERSTRGGVLAAIAINGRAQAPRIELQSTPSLPTEDIMALVLFDKPANELTALESLQVAQALAALSGVGPFGGEGVAGRARAALGLDLLSFDFEAADAGKSSLTIGKYVADGLFVSATQDARGENGSLRLEYEIGRSFSIETELRQDGDQKVSGNWKRDF